MRISTGMIFDAGVSSINKQTSSLLHLQQQVSNGRRILTPSDDPVNAARALEVTQSQDIVAQFKQNNDNANSALGLEETQLSSATDLLARVRELAVQAGNSSLTTSDRRSITSELRARFDELTGIANATDGAGQYLFSGFMGSTKPFGGTVASIISGSEISYQGDDGQRQLQVSPTRFLDVSDSGNDVFKRIVNGNGSFVTNYAVSGAGISTNAGTGIIDAGSIINSSGATTNLAGPYTKAIAAATSEATLATTSIAAATAESLLGGATVASMLAAVPALPASMKAAATAESLLGGATVASMLTAVTTAAPGAVAAAVPALPAAVKAAATTAAGLGGATPASVLAAVSAAATAQPAQPYAAALAAATTAAGLGGATAASVLAAVPAIPAAVNAAAAATAGLATTAVAAATTAAGLGGATAASVLAAVPAVPVSVKAAATAAAAATGATPALVLAAVSAAAPASVLAAVTTAVTAATGATWNLRPANNFSINFSIDNTVVPPVTYYDILNTATGKSMLTGATPITPPTATTGQRVYQSGQPIVLNNLIMDVVNDPASFGLGASVTITGDPANGDSFSITPSSSQSVFATIGKLIGALESANSGTSNPTTTLANDIGFALTNIDHATDNLLRVRSQIGSRMNEIDSLSSANTDLNLQYQQTLSNLQDLDYAKAISDLTRKQTDLQAAQQSFAKVSQLSLFNYL